MKPLAEDALSDMMRMVLHHPAFQALEFLWQGFTVLVSGLEADAYLKLYLFDISKYELAADLCSAEDLRSSGIYKLFVAQSVEMSGSAPWAVLAGCYTFAPDRKDWPDGKNCGIGRHTLYLQGG